MKSFIKMPPRVTSGIFTYLNDPESQNLVIMGNFNIDLLFTNSLTNRWLDLFTLLGLMQLTHDPKRVTISSRSIIDHISVSRTENIKLATVIKWGNSDHFPTALVYKRNSFTKHRHTYATYRSYKSLDEASFRADLGNAPWSLLDSCDNVDYMLDIWYRLFNSVVDIHLPVEKKNCQAPHSTGLDKR